MAEIFDESIDFSQFLRESDAKAKVKTAPVWFAGMIEKLGKPDQTKRVYMPWDKCKNVFDFRPGEVTLWAGQNGHGKTQVVSQVMLSLIGQGERVCIASFEMKPETTLARMARMYACENPFSPEFQQDRGIDAVKDLYREVSEWTNKRLWLYDQTGTVSADRVIGMARYCAKELGITHIAIDSLMKCVQGEDDYNGQKVFVDELTALARDNSVHIHLIHHTRKPQNESHIPDKYDNKGSGAITDLVDNVMMVWRNKGKEDEWKKHAFKSNRQTEPDAQILCRKQRNGEDEPTISLWFDKPSQQYKGSPDDPLQFFPNYPHRPTPCQ